ncbi:fer-1-like protein 5 [Pelodytes ibericus]
MGTPQDAKDNDTVQEGVKIKHQRLHWRKDPNDSVQDFQIRVRIISGRQLYGNNIKPVVKVLVGKKAHQTCVRQGNNPYFNETFFQDFHQQPSKVFEESVYIKVMNARAVRADSLIGVFKIDIGNIYDAPARIQKFKDKVHFMNKNSRWLNYPPYSAQYPQGHVILRKWLSLYDPDNLSTGVRGYLKVSLYALGAGSSVPVEEEDNPDEDDVESNILSIPSLHSRIACVCVKIFRAEDIPQGGEFFQRPNQSQTFLFDCRIAHFQFAADNCPQSEHGSVCVNDKTFVRDWCSQHRSMYKGVFQSLKRRFTGGRPQDLSGKVLFGEEGQDLGLGPGCGPVSDSFYLDRLWPLSPTPDPVAQILDFSHAYMAFVWLQSQASGPNLIQNCPHMPQVLFPGLAIDRNVIQGPRTFRPYSSSKGENPVDSCGTSVYANRSTGSSSPVEMDPGSGETVNSSSGDSDSNSLSVNHSLLSYITKFFHVHSAQKVTVDPYVKVSFAGKTLKTNIVYKNGNPVWNQMLIFPVQLPTVCEFIKLTVYDWNQVGHTEALGSTFLSISQLSSTGSEVEGDYMGFPPVFGPSFLPLYGSPREFSGVKNDLGGLNLGKREGVPYCGRLLLQVETSTEDKPVLKIEQIPQSDIFKAEWSMSRQKYALAAIFYSATMIPDGEDLVQFEISMGNYGNKFDVTCKPVSSTTQYSQAVFDGNYYYYLPWYDTKPVVALSSEWEDTTLRMEALNILQSLRYTLEENLNALRRGNSSGKLEQDNSWKSRLQHVKKMCGQKLPPPDSKHSTSLDHQLHTKRCLFLQDMACAIKDLLNYSNPGPELYTHLDDWLQRLTELTHEPQISLPDVIIWMLFKDKRVAYTRLCPADILYSPRGSSKGGIHCGKLQTIFLKHLPGQEKAHVPVQLRLRLWLSLMSDTDHLETYFPGEICVCAETYENQAKCLGRWSSKALGSHPAYSDITGKLCAAREKFQPPEGWDWDGEWYMETQRRVLLDRDTNQLEEVEEVYENETRLPGGPWIPALIPNTSASVAKHPSKEEIVCPQGWHFVEEWELKHNRAVDHQGWEYSVGALVSWSAAEKTYHTNRRRHWQRKRQRDVKAPISDTEVTNFLKLHSEKKESSMWEYSSSLEWKFHLKKQPTDVYRRRCWRRILVPREEEAIYSIFLLEGSMELDLDKMNRDKGKETKNELKGVLHYNTPLIYCQCQDPYIQVAFLHVSQRTEVQPCTYTPVWDQTIVFSDILLYGDQQSVIKEPPCVTMELFDKLKMGKDKFLGRSLCYPVVCLNAGTRVPPSLEWHQIKKGQRSCGEVLAAFELLLDEKDGKMDSITTPSLKDNGNFMVPKEICPILKLMALEVLAWGIRAIKTFYSLSIYSPSLLVECGGQSVQTSPIRDIKRNPNFPNSVLLMKVYLPEERYYLPPIVLKLLDNRPFGYKPLIGHCTIRDLKPYFIDPVEYPLILPARMVSSEHLSEVTEAQMGKYQKAVQVVDEFDWWSKFFASVNENSYIGNYLEEGHDILKVYDTELESVPEFHGLQDFCQTFKLHYGSSLEEEERDEPTKMVGEVKGLFRIYPIPEDPEQLVPPAQFHDIPENSPQECLLRVYIVRALGLPPRDRTGLCDPYLRISVGKKKMDNREEYIPCTLNPVFGKLFELSCVIPLEKDLKVSVFDYDVMLPDDKIGETTIDLENRLLSRFGANCGLPQTYSVSGPNRWRDQLLPSKLLQNLCSDRRWNCPVFTKNKQEVLVNNTKMQLSEFEKGRCLLHHLGPPKERLSLYVLHTLGLVPEHVETRILRNPVNPDMQQGKLQMWVDIFPKCFGLPGPACNITTRVPKRYVLRCIVWGVNGVDLQDSSIFGEKMSDIYIKGWMEGMETEKQRTDIHYRSLDGTGAFNWRFVFHFQYLDKEQMCVIQKKDHLWSLDKRFTQLPPKLIIQVWDNDKFSADDFLGVLELNLAHMPRAKQHPEDCSLRSFQETGKSQGWLQFFWPSLNRPQFFSLFQQKSVRGWWPCVKQYKGKPQLMGKVELSLEVVTELEAEERPAGKGREDPNMNPKLDPPVRPETSFLWFTSPLKSLYYIIWRKYRCRFLLVLFAIIILLLLAVFIYSSSGYLSMKVVKPLSSDWTLSRSEGKDDASIPKKVGNSVRSNEDSSIPSNEDSSITRKEESSIPRNKESSIPRKEDNSIPRKEDSSVLGKEYSSVLRKEDSSISRKEESSFPKKEDSSMPTKEESSLPTKEESSLPTKEESSLPTKQDSSLPTKEDGSLPTKEDTSMPTKKDSSMPTKEDSSLPTKKDTSLPTKEDSSLPTKQDSGMPTKEDSSLPTKEDSSLPTKKDTSLPTKEDSSLPTKQDSGMPTKEDSSLPTKEDSN